MQKKRFTAEQIIHAFPEIAPQYSLAGRKLTFTGIWHLDF